jgi:hypothetical protein
MKVIDVNSHNLCLLDFSIIFNECEVDIINDLHQFDLLDEFMFQNKDTKKIIYHHIIHHLCENVIHHMTFNRIVVVYNSNDLNSSQLGKLSSKFRMSSFMTSTLNKIKNILPIRIFMSDIKFDEINSHIHNDQGEKIELLTKLQTCHNRVSSFQKVKKFAKKYDLNFLSLEFFNRIRTKNLMFS